MNCRKCHEKLSSKEAKEYYEAMEGGYFDSGNIICDECFEMENGPFREYGGPSDADMGLWSPRH